MITSETFKKLADLRLREAQILEKNDCFSGCYYLAGYAVECGLKAIICLDFNKNVLPDKNFVNAIYTHKIEDLIKLAGLDHEKIQRTKEKGLT